MSENDAGDKVTKKKPTALLLRKRLGNAPAEIVERSKEQTRIRRTIVEVLQQGPSTVPEVAQASGLPSHEVLWHLMAMKKYGEVVEGDQRGDYYEYALAQKQEQTK
jgi:predicted transcriptional regulator